MVVLWFKLFKPEIYKSRAGMSDSNIIGEVGLLVREVAPFERGQVRFQKPLVGSEVWECIADQTIASGARVKVLSIEGSLLKVGPA
jgi:membrane-bound ClpP family serine protease